MPGLPHPVTRAHRTIGRPYEQLPHLVTKRTLKAPYGAPAQKMVIYLTYPVYSKSFPGVLV